MPMEYIDIPKKVILVLLHLLGMWFCSSFVMDNSFSYSLDISPFGLLNKDDLLGWLIIGHHRILYIYSGRQLRGFSCFFHEEGIFNLLPSLWMSPFRLLALDRNL